MKPVFGGIRGIGFTFLLVNVLLATAVRAIAENNGGAFTISPFGGGQMSLFVGDEHLDGDYKWGIRGGYNFTPHLGAEFVFGENKTVHDPEVTRATIYQYGGDLLYHFRPDKHLVPFVAVGLGAFNVDFDEPTPFSNRRTAYFNFGGGVKYFLTSSFALRADVRHTITFDRGDHLFEGTIGFELQVGRR